LLLSGKKFIFPSLWPPEYLSHARSLGEDSPLFLIGNPSPEEEEEDPECFADPTGESKVSPLPFLYRKYEDRVLILVASRCFFYCRFCFRRGNPPGESRGVSPGDLKAIRDYVAENPVIEEVIFSGGDPLTLDNRQLEETLGLFAAIESVKRLRIHTRAPLVFPERIDAGLANALKNAGKPVEIVLHAVHPAELRPTLEEGLLKLRGAQIALGNQTVLLKGVNDRPETLEELFYRLGELGVSTRYLHHTDRASGNRRFRLSIPSGLAIHSRLSSISRKGAPPYVIDLPDGSGKVPVSSLSPVAEERAGELRRMRYRSPRESGFEWWDIFA
jgi:lysine 2,3-aminomutase